MKKPNKTSKRTRHSVKKKVVVNQKTLIKKINSFFANLKNKHRDFLNRRPHRSFRKTLKRDYTRSMVLPGYFAFTGLVLKVFFDNKRIFWGVIFVYAALTALSASMMSEDTYQSLREIVEGTSYEGQFKNFVPILGLFWGVFASQVTGVSFGDPGSAQQAVGIMFALFAWLSTIWLTRAVMIGQSPRIRDGVYSSGGPVIALILLVFVLIIQLIPAIVALVAYASADATGLLDQTAVLMLFGGGAILLITLSLYWVVSTLIAMVVVTLPGMYPMKALRLAGDLVVGRRVRLALRIVWLLTSLFLLWAVVLIPTILIDSSLKSSFQVIEWLPLVPIVALMLMSFSIVISAVYIYMLYRKVVADEAPPA